MPPYTTPPILPISHITPHITPNILLPLIYYFRYPSPKPKLAFWQNIRIEKDLKLESNWDIKKEKNFWIKKNDERAGIRNLADLQMLKMNDCLKATVDDVRVCYSIGYQGIPYETGEDVIKAIRNWHKISGKIDQVHIFSHSSYYAIFGGKEDDLWGIYVNDHQGMNRSEGARFVREIPTDCWADNVIFVLHGCHTADNSKSFAKQLFDHLNKNRKTPKVFGHFGKPGVSANTYWKEFSNGSPNGIKLPGGLPPKIYQPFTINHTNKIMKVRNAYEPYKYPLY